MQLKRTPLYEVHRALGAKFVGFSGWELPIRYTSIMEEHRRVRSFCGLFDVSHMGEIEVSGEGALPAVELLTTNRASALRDGQCQYTLICNGRGGVVDDALLYRLSSERFLFCVNASNTDKVYNWTRENASGIAGVRDVSMEYAQIALQGPISENILKPLCSPGISRLKYFHFVITEVCKESALISRTGYTGEDGFELYSRPESAEKIWKAIIERGEKGDGGAPAGILPCGLGARDTLRLEMGYPLYGAELDEATTPLEAGLKRFVSLDKERFIGKETLMAQARKGVDRTLVGFKMIESGIPRSHYKILKDGEAAGIVTSGSFSPSLGCAIGMGYVRAALCHPGTVIEVDIRGKSKKAQIVGLPFYRRQEAFGAFNRGF